jgi:hypothetical protein
MTFDFFNYRPSLNIPGGTKVKTGKQKNLRTLFSQLLIFTSSQLTSCE